jgi:uncharacterized protein YdhG (YjbR/CyaY superfamily)
MNTYKTIDEYISNFPPHIQEVLQKIRQTIQQAAPQATEKISYGIPTFTQSGNLIHFAAYDKHYGLYPGAAPVEALKDELKGYTTSKGTIQLPIDKPVPYDLITRITKVCVERNISKKK